MTTVEIYLQRSQFSGQLNNYAWKEIFGDSKKTREQYLVDGNWQDIPANGNTADKLYTLEYNDFIIGNDVLSAWNEINIREVQKPNRPDAVIQRMMQARTNNTNINLYVPWDIRTSGTSGIEKKAMGQISDLKKVLGENSIDSNVIITPADIYASELLNIKPEIINNYLAYLNELAEENGFICQPWSEIRAQNADIYSAQSISLQSNMDNLPATVYQETADDIRRKSETANTANLSTTARAYLKEKRLEEEVIEQVYKPVRVSLTKSNKNLNNGMPQICVIPEAEQYPWMK